MTRLSPLRPAETAARLIARSFPPPWDAKGMGRALDTCAESGSSTPAFDLAFRPDRSAVAAVVSLARDLGPG